MSLLSEYAQLQMALKLAPLGMSVHKTDEVTFGIRCLKCGQEVFVENSDNKDFTPLVTTVVEIAPKHQCGEE